MAIIYTYPTKAVPNANDLILISDSEDSNKTKQVAISTLPGGSGSGTSSVTSANVAITVANPTTTPVLTSVAYSGGTSIGHVPAGSGSSASVYLDGTGSWSTPAGSGGPGTGTANSIPKWATSSTLGDSNIVDDNSTVTFSKDIVIKGQGTGNPSGKLKLNCEENTLALTLEGPAHSGGADYTLKFPSVQSTGTQILQADSSGLLSWIATPSGGGGGVSQVTAGGVLGTSSGAPISISPTTGNVVVTSQAYAGTTNVGHVPSGGSSITFLRGDGTWVTPTNTTYSAGTGLSLLTNTFSLATNAALTNLGGGTGSTFLQKDGTWATTTDTNIANYNLQLNNSRNLDLSNGDATDYALTFISTLGGASKNLFKFGQIGGTSPQFTVGHMESAYEGYIVLEGNGSNRTGIIQFENAAGTYYTSFQAPNTFGANQNIGYVLPNLQGAANSVLTNNGSGSLSWATTSEPTEITSTTTVNSTTFATTPFTFANTNGGSGIGAPVATQVASSYGNKHMAFYLNTTFSGAINQSGANTVNYATSSDYRLKENVIDMIGSVDRLKQLKPSKFNFIADGPSRTVDGFLAHEVSNIVPEAITGSKDAIDAEGNIIPQGIDQSKLVPLLVGAIKELTARIEALEA